jgi:hypothetical protein
MLIKTLEDLKRAFHPVASKELTEEMKARITRLEYACVEFGSEIIDLVPECADRTAALRKLLEAKFTCVQAITHTRVETKEVKKDGKNAQQNQKAN